MTADRSPAPVEVRVLGHLIYYLPAETRQGTEAVATVPEGTALWNLSSLLGIPEEEIQSFVVNGQVTHDRSRVLGLGDTVVVLPVISSG